jgi:hypothetical protein
VGDSGWPFGKVTLSHTRASSLHPFFCQQEWRAPDLTILRPGLHEEQRARGSGKREETMEVDMRGGVGRPGEGVQLPLSWTRPVQSLLECPRTLEPGWRFWSAGLFLWCGKTFFQTTKISVAGA